MTGPAGQPDAAMLHRSGIAAAQRGQGAQARQMLEKAAAMRPNALPILVDLGQVQLMTGDQAAATETFQRCVKIDPGLVPAWLNLGILMMHAYRTDEAAECFQKAAEGNPKLVDAHMGLGVVRQRQKRPKEAVAAFQRAAALAPDNPEVLSNLGGALHEAGDARGAVPCFRKAIELAPQHAALHTHLGSLLHEVEGGEAGLPHYNDALRLVPGEPRTLALKGSALIGLGRAEEAARIFDHDALVASQQFTEAPGYPDLDAFNRDLASHSVSHPSLVQEPLGRTTRGGGQTGQLFGAAEGPFPVLEQMLRGAIDAYFADPARSQHPYCPIRTKPGHIFAWATVLDSGGYQDPHNHPSGVLSGVYYVQLPESGEPGAIEFGRPAAPFTAPSEPDVKLIRPATGKVVLFPSFYWHRTIPFPGEGRRISIAFDLMMDG